MSKMQLFTTKLFVTACVGLGVFVDASTASAALPPLYCIDISDYRRVEESFFSSPGQVGMCVANVSGYQWAGLRIEDLVRSVDGAPIRLELSFFDFDQFPLGGSIPLVSSAPFHDVTTSDRPINIETGRIAWWHAGVFCARLVNDSNGHWEDIACVDTNGNAR
jgi:hypothetical protein